MRDLFWWRNQLDNCMFNYDYPIAQKNISGVDVRITQGLIEKRSKTYLMYVDGMLTLKSNCVDNLKNEAELLFRRLP